MTQKATAFQGPGPAAASAADPAAYPAADPASEAPAVLPLALLALLLGAFLRCPSIFLHGRIWGEELPTFLLGSWNHSVSSVFFAQHFGYYSLWDNTLADIAVHLLPLTVFALFFSYSAVVILLLTAWFIYRSEFLPTRRAKLLGILALLLTAPSSETWLNVLNSEFYFGIWGALILLSDASRFRLQRYAGLALAVFSGPLTTLLAPLYLLRALLRRTRDHILQALLVTCVGLLQIGIALFSARAVRKVAPDPLALGAAMLAKNFIILFLSRMTAKLQFLLLTARLHFSPLAFLACWLLLFAGLALLYFVARRRKPALYLLFVAFWCSLIEVSMALEGTRSLATTGGGERYAYLPNVLIVLALIVVASSALANLQRTTARVLLTLAFLSGFVDYLILPLHETTHFGGEPWRQQVLRWQKDPATRLHGSPSEWPSYTLPPRQ